MERFIIYCLARKAWHFRRVWFLFFLPNTWICININKTFSKIPLKMQKMIISGGRIRMIYLFKNFACLCSNFSNMNMNFLCKKTEAEGSSWERKLFVLQACRQGISRCQRNVKERIKSYKTIFLTFRNNKKTQHLGRRHRRKGRSWCAVLKVQMTVGDHYFNLPLAVVSNSAYCIGFSSKGIYLNFAEIHISLLHEEISLSI